MCSLSHGTVSRGGLDHADGPRGDLCGGRYTGRFEDDWGSDCRSAPNEGRDTSGGWCGVFESESGLFGRSARVGYGDGRCCLWSQRSEGGWSSWSEDDPRFEDDSPRPFFFFPRLPRSGESLGLSVDGPPGGFEDDLPWPLSLGLWYGFLFELPGRFKFPVGSEGWSGWPESDPRFEDDSPRPLFFFSHFPPPGGSLRLSIDRPGVLFEDDPGGFEDDSLGPSLFFFCLPPRYRPFGRSSRVKGLSVDGPAVVPEGRIGLCDPGGRGGKACSRGRRPRDFSFGRSAAAARS